MSEFARTIIGSLLFRVRAVFLSRYFLNEGTAEAHPILHIFHLLLVVVVIIISFVSVATAVAALGRWWRGHGNWSGWVRRCPVRRPRGGTTLLVESRNWRRRRWWWWRRRRSSVPPGRRPGRPVGNVPRPTIVAAVFVVVVVRWRRRPDRRLRGSSDGSRNWRRRVGRVPRRRPRRKPVARWHWRLDRLS